MRYFHAGFGRVLSAGFQVNSRSNLYSAKRELLAAGGKKINKNKAFTRRNEHTPPYSPFSRRRCVCGKFRISSWPRLLLHMLFMCMCMCEWVYVCV